VGEDLLTHNRIFNAGNDLGFPATFTARLDIDIEDPLQSLCPVHGRATFGRRFVLPLIWRFGLFAFAPLCGRHLRPMFAVGRKDSVKARQVDARLRH
jgi:hypothetical protein